MRAISKVLFFFLLSSVFLFSSCEDDPILDDTSGNDDGGSYGKLRLPSSDSNIVLDENDENNEVF